MGTPAYDNPEFTRMPIFLKGLLIEAGLTVSDYAKAIHQGRGHVKGKPLSYTAAAHLINYGNWPKLTTREEIMRQTAELLTARGIPAQKIASAFDIDEQDQYRGLHPVGTTTGRASRAANDTDPNVFQETDMLLRAESVRPATRKHFHLFRNPFAEDVTDARDIFMWPDYRYAREALWDAARHHGFRAVVGESGSGKTTLVHELRERIVATDRVVRDASDKALRSFVQRQTGVKALEWLSTEQATAVIEALKAWHKRVA